MRPSAATTRWHGTRGAKGLRRIAWPTARALEAGGPSARARSPYVVALPAGTAEQSAYTRASNAVGGRAAAAPAPAPAPLVSSTGSRLTPAAGAAGAATAAAATLRFAAGMAVL